MPEMSWPARAFCTSRAYRAVAWRVLVPWGLQGFQLSGDALEIGSGSGVMAAEFLTAFPNLCFMATDYDPQMVEIARQTLGRFGARATVQRADASHLPFPDGRFDVVLSFAMLHHVGVRESAVSEAVRVLRPGGSLIRYDLLDVLPFRIHRGDGHGARMLRPGQLEAVARHLPLTTVRTRRGLGGLMLRFVLTKDGSHAVAAS